MIGREEASAKAVRAAVLDITSDVAAAAATRDMQSHVLASGGAVRAAAEILAHIEGAGAPA